MGWKTGPVIAPAPDTRPAAARQRPAHRRGQDLPGSKHASARSRTCQAPRRGRAGVSALVTSGFRPAAAGGRGGSASYNDPINRQDPTGLRPNDDAFDVATTVPPDPTCPDGQSVLSTPGSPSQHRSSYQICGSPDTSDGFVEVVNWLARWNKSAALLAFHANLLLYTSSPLNEGLAYRQAKVAIRSGAALRICAEDGTSVGGGHGAIRTHVMCLWNVPRFAVGAFIVNADALAYTQGHYVFCKAKENCGSPSDLRYPNQLAHELVHVRQWETYGDAFAGMYLGEEARGNSGQCKNPYEREAYDVAPIDSDGKLRCQK